MTKLSDELQDSEKIIFDILQKYPEEEWFSQCRKLLPNEDDISIMATIEILNGGDVLEV